VHLKNYKNLVLCWLAIEEKNPSFTYSLKKRKKKKKNNSGFSFSNHTCLEKKLEVFLSSSSNCQLSIFCIFVFFLLIFQYFFPKVYFVLEESTK